MSVLKSWKILLALAAIFGAGAVVGGMVTVRLAKTAIAERTDVNRYSDVTMNKLRKDLELSPEQTQNIKPVVDAAGNDLLEIFERTRGEITEVLNRSGAKVRVELNEDQEKRFDEMLSKANTRLRDGIKAR